MKIIHKIIIPLIFSIFFKFPSKITAQTSPNAALQFWGNFTGSTMEETHREKRFILELTTAQIIWLFCFNGFAGPFLQAQLSLKINVISWFQKGGCINRMWKNKKFGCQPTAEEVVERHLIQQIYMHIFSGISEETAQLLQFEHSLMLGLEEPKPSSILSSRESLYLLLFKYHLIPLAPAKIPETLLTKMDVNSLKLHEKFKEVQQKEAPSTEQCEKAKKQWESIDVKVVKHIPENQLQVLLQCECIQLFDDWTKTGGNLIGTDKAKNCMELLDSYKMPEFTEKQLENFVEAQKKEMEEITAEDAPELVPPELIEQEQEFVMKMEEEIKQFVIESEMKRQREIEQKNALLEMENRKEQLKSQRAYFKAIWKELLEAYRFYQNDFMFFKRLEQNLLEKVSIGEQKHLQNKFVAQILSNGSIKEEIHQAKCLDQSTFQPYTQNCIVFWDHGEDGKATLFLNYRMMAYLYPPKLFIFIEEKFHEAKQELDKSAFSKKLQEKQQTNRLKQMVEDVQQIYILIQLRRQICSIFEFAKIQEERRKKKLKRRIKDLFIWERRKSSRIHDEDEAVKSADFVENEERKLSKSLLKEFGKICNKFYARNVEERRELLAIDGFRELDLIAQRRQQNFEEFFEVNKENRTKKIETDDKRFLGIKWRRGSKQKKMQEISGEEKEKKFESGVIHMREDALVRTKRFDPVTPLIGFTLALIFLQIYLRIHKDYDPIRLLWMCIKFPRSGCKVPQKILKEIEFIRRAKLIVVQEVQIQTFPYIRKLYELHYLRNLVGKNEILLPSAYFAKFELVFNIRNSFILDCYYYNWNEDPDGKPKDLNFLPLEKLLAVSKRRCISTLKFKPAKEIPKLLKPIFTHCTLISGIFFLIDY